MRNTKNYTINHENETITITRDFIKRAGTINSEEYNALLQFRKDYPDYKVIKRTATAAQSKNTHKGLDIPFMERFIAQQDNAAEVQAELKRVKTIYKGHPAYYAMVKKWFLAKYPEYKKQSIATSEPAPAQDTEEKPLALVG